MNIPVYYTMSQLREKKMETSNPSQKDDKAKKSNEIISKHVNKTINLHNIILNTHYDDKPSYSNYDNKILFSKGLRHNNELIVNSNDINILTDCIKYHDVNKLEKLKFVGDLKLLNPSSSWYLDIIGSSSTTYKYSKFPNIDSKEFEYEMCLLYCMYLCRDIPFSNYTNNSAINQYCKFLSVEPTTIFRDPLFINGLYISQFLYLNFTIGNCSYNQRYRTYLENLDFYKTVESMTKLQNGISDSTHLFNKKKRYIITGRDLAHYFHSNDPYFVFTNTYSILCNINAPIIIKQCKFEEPYLNFGKADVPSLLTMIGRNALLVAWYIKWSNMVPRPDQISLLLNKTYSKNKESLNIFTNPIFDKIYGKNKNILLPQCYNKGSNMCPSTPSEYATVAGACITVLKLIFDNNFEMNVTTPDLVGFNLVNKNDKSTIGIELDKLAFNVAISQCWAGTNFAIDNIKGLKLGEAVAINCMKDVSNRYPDKINFKLKKFNGKFVSF